MVKLYKKIDIDMPEKEFRLTMLDCAQNQIPMEIGTHKQLPGMFMEIGEIVKFDGDLLIKVNGGCLFRVRGNV